MMDSARYTFAAAALLLACACGAQTPPASQAVAGCSRTATHNVRWSDSQAADTITAHADGPTCLQAMVTFVVRNARGDPLWTFASTYYDMTTGGIAPSNAPAVSSQQVDAFLARWANVTAQNTAQLPEWRQGASHVIGSGGFTYNTSYSRDSYEAIRQRNTPMICFAAAVATTQCLIIDPSSNVPAMIVAYGS